MVDLTLLSASSCGDCHHLNAAIGRPREHIDMAMAFQPLREKPVFEGHSRGIHLGSSLVGTGQYSQCHDSTITALFPSACFPLSYSHQSISCSANIDDIKAFAMILELTARKMI